MPKINAKYVTILLFVLFLAFVQYDFHKDSNVYSKKMNIYLNKNAQDSYLTNKYKNKLLYFNDTLFSLAVVRHFNNAKFLSPDDFISTVYGYIIEDYYNYDFDYRFSNNKYLFKKKIKMGGDDVVLQIEFVEKDNHLFVDNIIGLELFLEKANTEFLKSEKFNCN